MRKSGFILMLAAVAILVLINATIKSMTERNSDYPMPDEVKSVVDKSCYGCHSENGKSDKAKTALRWDRLNEYDQKKLVTVFDEMVEVLEKTEMPPEKFLASKPEAKPTEEEYAILLKWAENEAEKALEK